MLPDFHLVHNVDISLNSNVLFKYTKIILNFEFELESTYQ
jgi:hypothetical protein